MTEQAADTLFWASLAGGLLSKRLDELRKGGAKPWASGDGRVQHHAGDRRGSVYPRSADNVLACSAVILAAILILAVASLSGCGTARADGRLRDQTAVADGIVRTWDHPRTTDAQRRAAARKLRRALWVQRAIRLDEWPEDDPSLRAELEALEEWGTPTPGKPPEGGDR